MGNVYKDHRDDAISDMLESAINKLKSAGGVKPQGYRDHSKPPLDYGPLPPLPIKQSMPKKMRIDRPA
jgi:hypothetical protein